MARDLGLLEADELHVPVAERDGGELPPGIALPARHCGGSVEASDSHAVNSSSFSILLKPRFRKYKLLLS